MRIRVSELHHTVQHTLQLSHVVSYVTHVYILSTQVKPSSSCLAFIQCVAHLVERLAQGVSVSPYTLLRKLLLQAGDVEVNPGPTHSKETALLVG